MSSALSSLQSSVSGVLLKNLVLMLSDLLRSLASIMLWLTGSLAPLAIGSWQSLVSQPLLAVSIGIFLASNPLAILGFGALGPTAGSAAALWQASYAGYVPAGSLFATLQSLGMTVGPASQILGQGLAAAGIAIWASREDWEKIVQEVTNWFHTQKDSSKARDVGGLLDGLWDQIKEEVDKVEVESMIHESSERAKAAWEDIKGWGGTLGEEVVKVADSVKDRWGKFTRWTEENLNIDRVQNALKDAEERLMEGMGQATNWAEERRRELNIEEWVSELERKMGGGASGG